MLPYPLPDTQTADVHLISHEGQRRVIHRERLIPLQGLGAVAPPRSEPSTRSNPHPRGANIDTTTEYVTRLPLCVVPIARSVPAPSVFP